MAAGIIWSRQMAFRLLFQLSLPVFIPIKKTGDLPPNSHAHNVMASQQVQWKPFWLASQLNPQIRVNCDVCGQGPTKSHYFVQFLH